MALFSPFLNDILVPKVGQTVPHIFSCKKKKSLFPQDDNDNCFIVVVLIEYFGFIL